MESIGPQGGLTLLFVLPIGGLTLLFVLPIESIQFVGRFAN
jgi:hypothetical protein